jgi:capsular polysaccharide biosynthesis protein
MNMLRRYVTLLIVATVIGASAAALYSWAGADEYRSTTRLFLTTNALDVSDVYQAMLAGQQRVLTYRVLASDPHLLSDAVARAGMRTDPDTVRKNLHVDVPPATIILDISVDDTNPVSAAKLANAVADELIATINELERPLGGGPAPVTMTVVQRAAPPATPRAKLDPVLVAAGAIAGFILGLAVAWAVQRRPLRTLRGARGEVTDRDLVTEIPLQLHS